METRAMGIAPISNVMVFGITYNLGSAPSKVATGNIRQTIYINTCFTGGEYSFIRNQFNLRHYWFLVRFLIFV